MDRSSENDGKQNYARWAGLGIEFGGVVGLFCYMGYKLDEAFKTSPAFLLGGFFVGFIGMLYPRQKHSGAGPQYPGQIGLPVRACTQTGPHADRVTAGEYFFAAK